MPSDSMRLVYWLGIAAVIIGVLVIWASFLTSVPGPTGGTMLSVQAMTWGLRLSGIGLVLVGVALASVGSAKSVHWPGIATVIMGLLVILTSIFAPTIGPSGVAALAIEPVTWGLRFFGIGFILIGVALASIGLKR